MGCEHLSDAGFLSGFLHGFVALVSLVLGMFFDVHVYDKCQNSWLYDFGFVLGLGIAARIGLGSLTSFAALLVLAIMIFVALMLGGLMVVGGGLAVVAIVAYIVFDTFLGKKG